MGDYNAFMFEKQVNEAFQLHRFLYLPLTNYFWCEGVGVYKNISIPLQSKSFNAFMFEKQVNEAFQLQFFYTTPPHKLFLV